MILNHKFVRQITELLLVVHSLSPSLALSRPLAKTQRRTSSRESWCKSHEKFRTKDGKGRPTVVGFARKRGQNTQERWRHDFGLAYAQLTVPSEDGLHDPVQEHEEDPPAAAAAAIPAAVATSPEALFAQRLAVIEAEHGCDCVRIIGMGVGIAQALQGRD